MREGMIDYRVWAVMTFGGVLRKDITKALRGQLFFRITGYNIRVSPYTEQVILLSHH